MATFKEVTYWCFLFMTCSDSANDVKKNPQGVHAPSTGQKYGQTVIRHSEVGYGFKTTGQKQNRSIRYLHPTKEETETERDRIAWVCQNDIWCWPNEFSTLICACPTLNKTKKRSNCQKWLLTTTSVLFTSGEISLNYTGIDRNSDWDRRQICFGMNYASFQSSITTCATTVLTLTLWGTFLPTLN